ncbi:hypothetical protein ACFSQP_11580 [Bizionia sediminis]|uniref:SGNH/GDSL hydrolase family protein n=1 Tax=Bizionia sediminis TaxID=1737064 RepID=A0ABW5KVG2_9FLAO
MGFLIVEGFYRFVPNNYAFKHAMITQNKAAIETLVFGDSHTFYGVNPNYFNSHTFNLANVSQTLYFDTLLFEAYVADMPNLKTVILAAEYSNLSQEDNTQEDIWRKYFYARYMHLNVPLIKPYDVKKYSLALTQKFGKTVGYMQAFLKNKTLVGADSTGWGNTYKKAISAADLERLATIIAKKHDDGTADISKNIARLETLIKSCQEKNIAVILVNMPVSLPYLQKLNQNEVTAITEATQQLANNYSHVTAINFLGDRRFKRVHFHDADHLNQAGAALCSNILNAVINKP